MQKYHSDGTPIGADAWPARKISSFSFYGEIKTCLKDNTVGYIHNYVRDFWWGFATTLSLGIVNGVVKPIANPAINWLPPTYYQLAVCAIAQSTYQWGYNVYHRKSGDFWEKRIRDSGGAFAAAYAAIFCWNYGQYQFESWAVNWGWNPIQAAMFSAIGAGLGEGWVQYVVKAGFNTVYDTYVLKQNGLVANFKANFSFTDFGYSIIPGLIPGASWQVANGLMSVYANPSIVASVSNPAVGLLLASIATGFAINHMVLFWNVMFDVFTNYRKHETNFFAKTSNFFSKPSAKLSDSEPLLRQMTSVSRNKNSGSDVPCCA